MSKIKEKLTWEKSRSEHIAIAILNQKSQEFGIHWESSTCLTYEQIRVKKTLHLHNHHIY